MYVLWINGFYNLSVNIILTNPVLSHIVYQLIPIVNYTTRMGNLIHKMDVSIFVNSVFKPSVIPYRHFIGMERIKPTRCYTMVYWTLWIAQHVSGITMPIIRSSRLYRWSQRMAPHFGYGRLPVWCMAVGFWSVRLEGCFTTGCETSL